MIHLTRSKIHEAKIEKDKHNGMNQNGFSLFKPKAPVVGKVSHHSIELYWEKDPNDTAKGDHGRVKYAIQEEDKRTLGFGTVYIGYADAYNIEGLEPQQQYKYRLKVTNEMGEASYSPIIEVATIKAPFTGEQLHRAIFQNNIDKVKTILQSGEVNIETTDKLGFTPLMSTSQSGNLQILNMLLDAGGKVNATNTSGKNSIMMACFGGHFKIVKRLRECGASWDCKDRGGSTPLHWAMDSGNAELVDWIIKDGAKVDLQDTTAGWTPLLRCAAMNGNVDTATCLIKSGAKVNAKDKDGKTPLMTAALNGHLNLVKLLVKSGADIHAKSEHGKTAVEMAKSFDRRHIVKFFEELTSSDDKL